MAEVNEPDDGRPDAPSGRSTASNGPDTGTGGGDDTPSRGSDIARSALEAARAARAARHPTGPSAARRGRTGGRGTGGAGTGGAARLRRRSWSGSGSDDRDPQTLGRLASRLSTQRGWSPRLTTGAVFGRWAELVGAHVADHAEPVSLHEGVLTVQAASTAWATELRLLQRQILARLAAGVGHGVVTSLRIHGPSAPSWRRGPRHVSGRGPRDTYG